MEISIVTAIRWLGMGNHEDAICDKFLNYVIALESLLIKKGDRGKTRKVAERSAFLIWGPNPKTNDIEMIKRLYGIRSEIVHEGREDIRQEDLNLIRSIAETCLFYLSEKTNEWSNIEGLIMEMKIVDLFSLLNNKSAS